MWSSIVNAIRFLLSTVLYLSGIAVLSLLLTASILTVLALRDGQPFPIILANLPTGTLMTEGMMVAQVVNWLHIPQAQSNPSPAPVKSLGAAPEDSSGLATRITDATESSANGPSLEETTNYLINAIDAAGGTFTTQHYSIYTDTHEYDAISRYKYSCTGIETLSSKGIRIHTKEHDERRLFVDLFHRAAGDVMRDPLSEDDTDVLYSELKPEDFTIEKPDSSKGIRPLFGWSVLDIGDETIYFRDQDKAERVLNAFARAAALSGVKKDPFSNK
jgi:hypothetical protein